jgi:hypothetical protein
MWTTHVERGLEVTMDISKVIKAGLTSEGISDINNHPTGKSYNESCILRVRRQFRRRIYDNGIPQHLKDWLDRWHTPLEDVQAGGRWVDYNPSYRPFTAITVKGFRAGRLHAADPGYWRNRLLRSGK